MLFNRTAGALALAALVGCTFALSAQDPAKAKKAGAKKAAKAAKTGPDTVFPPALPDGKTVVTDTAAEFLKPASTLKSGVEIAKTPPTVDFLYYPGQTYPGKPWSNWGDSLAADGKYYASVGDHLAPAGNAFVYEYDPAKKSFRLLADVKQILKLPEGHYVPGKIHGRLDKGEDGWIYFSTHRGSPTATTDANHYKGDWILRCHPADGRAEVVAQGPVPKHCIPCSVLDPKRLFFYGGTAPGSGKEEGAGIQFFAYDVRARKVLQANEDGPARYMALARSTGRVYYTPAKGVAGDLMRYDPAQGGPPVKLPGSIAIRAATQETPQGLIYTVSQGNREAGPTLYALNTKTEAVEQIGEVGVGSQRYIATLDADPTGRYLYFIAGAHGGSDTDGSPLVQYDVKTRKQKVLAFLHPFYQQKYGATLRGTYSIAVSETGERVYVTWNISRGSRAWDCTGLTVVHIPESERQP